MRLTKKELVAQSLQIPIAGNSETKFFSKQSGLLLSTGYTRIVIGDRGPYIEFAPEHIVKDNIEYQNVFHIWFDEYCSKCADQVFVYFQRQTVSYADYKIGMFYISPDLVKTDKVKDLIVKKEPQTLF